MKETQNNKKSKKKVLLYYLILAACLLVIAAVTVTVVFAVNRSKGPDLTIDNSVTPPDDEKKPDDDEKRADDTPTINPRQFVLPVETANVSTNYEFCLNPTIKMWCFHKGMDFAGNIGDKVCSALDGKVTKVVYQSTPAALMYGGYVTIEHANGITTTYKYVDVKEGLKEGDTIKRGDTIGTIAKASGIEMNQGDHLHFEVKVNGKFADPDVYLDIIEK